MSTPRTWSMLAQASATANWQLKPPHMAAREAKQKIEAKIKAETERKRLADQKMASELKRQTELKAAESERLEKLKAPCNACEAGNDSNKYLCHYCQKVFCNWCVDDNDDLTSVVCYNCAKVRGQTPHCQAIIDGHKCGIQLDPNTEYHDFFSITDPYIMECTYSGIPPIPKWLNTTKKLKLPMISDTCFKCHCDLCEDHVITRQLRPGLIRNACPTCDIKDRSNKPIINKK